MDCYFVGDKAKTIVNVGLREHADGLLVSDLSRNEYSFEAHTIINLKPIVIGVDSAVAVITLTACTAVYFNKRKKIIYTF